MGTNQWLVQFSLYISIALVLGSMLLMGVSYTKMPRRVWNQMKNVNKRTSTSNENLNTRPSSIEMQGTSSRRQSSEVHSMSSRDSSDTSSLESSDDSSINSLPTFSVNHIELIKEVLKTTHHDLNKINNLFLKNNNMRRKSLPALGNKDILKNMGSKLSLESKIRDVEIFKNDLTHDFKNIKLADIELKSVNSQFKALKRDVRMSVGIDTKLKAMYGDDNPYSNELNILKFSIDIDEVKIQNANLKLKMMKKKGIIKRRKLEEYLVYHNIPSVVNRQGKYKKVSYTL